MTHRKYVLAGVVPFVFGLTTNVAAETCDIELEGVTVASSRAQVVDTWSALGLHNITTSGVARHQRLDPDNPDKAVFASYPPSEQQAEEGVHLSWERKDDQVQIVANYSLRVPNSDGGRFHPDAVDRWEQYCPDKPIDSVVYRQPTISCEINPDDAASACSYVLTVSTRGWGYSEAVTLNPSPPVRNNSR